MPGKPDDRPENRIRLVWRGLFSNGNPHLIPPGAAQVQTNLTCTVPGELRGRKGMQKFNSSVGTGDITHLVAFRPPHADFLVYTTTESKVKALTGTTTAATLLTTLPVFDRASFTQASNGILYMATGLGPAYRWNGQTTTLLSAGIAAPSDQFTFAASTVAATGITATAYVGAYRYATDDETRQYSAITSFRTLTATVDKGFKWTGLDASSNTRTKFVQLFRSTSAQSTTVYLITTQGASGNITSSADSGGFIQFTVPAGHHLTAGARITVSGSTEATDNATHQLSAVTDTTLTTTTAFTGAGTGGSWTFEGFDNDLALDTTLNTAANQTGLVTGTASSGGNVQITIEAAHTIIVGSVLTLTNHPVSGYNNRPVLVRAISGSGAGSTVTLDMTYTSAGSAPFGNWTRDVTGGFGSAGLAVLDEFGELYARKQVVPPDYKRVAIWFQDRMWYGVDVFYNMGSITTAGTTAITGVSTAFTSEMVGRFLYIDDATETIPYRIVAVGSATSITLERATTTNAAGYRYTIRPNPALEDDWYYSFPDEPESVPITNVVRPQRREDTMDRWTGAMAYKDRLYVFKERSTYQIGFTKQAKIDAGVFFMYSRGAANHECCKMVEDVAYIMDEQGPWRMGANGPDYFDDRIHDFWRDTAWGTIISGDPAATQGAYKQSQWWFIEGDPIHGVVRFWVTDGSSTAVGRPSLCFAYNYRTDCWWKETYNWVVGGAAMIPYRTSVPRGIHRRFLGGEDDLVYLADEGTLDGTTGTGSAVRGTVAASSTTTTINLSDASASDCNGATLAITSGTGKQQLTRITAGQGTSILTVTALTTAPAEGDRYQIGAIPWTVKLGTFELLLGVTTKQRAMRLTYDPTDDTSANGHTWLDMRLYANHDSSPLDMHRTATEGNQVYYTDGSPDAEVDMDLTNGIGFNVFPFDGNLVDRVQGMRFVTPELRGYQGHQQIVLYTLDLDGVQG